MLMRNTTLTRLPRARSLSPSRAILVGFATLLTSNAVAAEDGDASNTNKLDAIVITGEKSEKSLKNTASSVSVISGLDVESHPQEETIEEALIGVPNILYTSKTDAPIIRGVDTKGPVQAGNAYLSKPIPRATISVDGRYLSSAEFGLGAATLWDVDSIEVFRGPQTTSQGANSIAGAVVIKTKDPTFFPELGGQVLYGSENKKRASLVASGPLGGDFAGRLALDYSEHDNFVTYTNPGFTAHGKDLDFDNFNARFKTLWRPSDLPGLEAKFTYSHTKIGRPSSEAVSRPYKDHKSRTLYVDRHEAQSDTGILDTRYELANNMAISNQLQYTDGDYDFYFSPPFAGKATRAFTNISDELRLNFGDAGSRFSGMSGVFYSIEDTDNKLLNALGWADTDIKQNSLGVFGEVTWRFVEDWSLTGGLRYQRDQIRHDGVSSYVPGVDYSYDETFDILLPKVTLAYDLSKDVTVGALVSRGYVPGGTGTDFSGNRYYTFDEETAWNYELFTRANMLDNRMLFTANLFYTVYDDSQRQVTDVTPDGRRGSIIVNGGEAVAYGVEMNLDYQATSYLRLHGSAGALHTKVTEFDDPRGATYEDNEFAKAPGYMVSAGAEWMINSRFSLRGEVQHTDGYFSGDDNDPSLEVDSYTLANASLSHYLNDNIEVLAYVDNIFDEDAPTEKFNDRTAGEIGAYIVTPREYGVGIKAGF